ncbi:hypothetical protein STANM309S_05886 [Streptomyces tanashiensis]
MEAYRPTTEQTRTLARERKLVGQCLKEFGSI